MCAATLLLGFPSCPAKNPSETGYPRASLWQSYDNRLTRVIHMLNMDFSQRVIIDTNSSAIYPHRWDERDAKLGLSGFLGLYSAWCADREYDPRID
jgi:hypothetical protein